MVSMIVILEYQNSLGENKEKIGVNVNNIISIDSRIMYVENNKSPISYVNVRYNDLGTPRSLRIFDRSLQQVCDEINDLVILFKTSR